LQRGRARETIGIRVYRTCARVSAIHAPVRVRQSALENERGRRGGSGGERGGEDRPGEGGRRSNNGRARRGTGGRTRGEGSMPVARTTAAPDLPSIRPGASAASRSVRSRAREGERPRKPWGTVGDRRAPREAPRFQRCASPRSREDRSQRGESVEYRGYRGCPGSLPVSAPAFYPAPSSPPL